MLSGPTSRAEQLIYQRRNQEQKLSNMQTKLKQQFHEQEFAKWQNKGKNIEINNQVRQKLASLRKASNANLQFRRQKLAAMLQDEDSQYKNEIIQMQETPEQTRERMAKRVKELKEEKQKRRLEDVNNKLQKRFELNADELRKVDQDLKQLKVAYERNLQLVEKQNLMQNQYEEEMLFAELNKRDIKKKEEAERIKKQQYQDKVDQRNAILAVQKDLRKRKEDEEKYMTEQEREMLRVEWERQSQLAKLKEKQTIDKQRDIHRTIHQENEKIKRDKEQQIKREKQADRQMIERIVMKQRQLAEYQKFMKGKEREEATKMLAGLKKKNQDMLSYEKELDRLIEIQRLKKQKKAQQDFEKREKARINLLYQVFDDRERKVKEHRSEKEEDLKIRQQDRIEVEKRVKEYQLEQERRKREEYEKNKAEQQKLLDEIALKEEKRRLLLQEIQREENEQQANRNDYNRKIEERKQVGRDQLDQFKKTNRLF